MESSIQNQPAKRKRGRPPGTKNRPKARAADGYRLAAAKPVDVDFEVRSINAVVERLDKAEGKVDQYYRTISQHIAAIKRAKPDDWKEIVKTQCKLGRTRAFELLAIADGRKTLEEVRAGYAERQKRRREKENGAVTSRTHAAIKDEGNSADPEAAAEARKAEFARMEDEGGKTAASPAGNGQALRESHQEALYKQACKLVSTMNATTRGSFIAYLVGQYGQPT